MKFTERFFSLPVRIYDRYTSQMAEEFEKANELPKEGEWAAGWAKIHYQDIDSWTDYFDSVQGIDGVKKDGFRFTIVWTKTGMVFICVWDKKKFEEKLDAYAEKYEVWLKDIIEKGDENLGGENENQLQ